MLHYIQKVSLQNRNDPILRDGWVIMGTGINTPKCHHRLSLEVCCGWFSSFLSFSLLFIHIFYFFFCSEHVFLLSFKKLKIINKMPPPRPTHCRQGVTMGGCPSTITTALPAQHNQRETMSSWGSLGHSHPTPHHSMEEVQRTILEEQWDTLCWPWVPGNYRGPRPWTSSVEWRRGRGAQGKVAGLRLSPVFDTETIPLPSTLKAHKVEMR